MIQETQDKICVRLCDKEGNYKTGYYSSNLADTLKMYEFMAQNDITLWYKKTNSEDEIECHISDIAVNFANDGNLLSLDLFCDIFDWSEDNAN